MRASILQSHVVVVSLRDFISRRQAGPLCMTLTMSISQSPSEIRRDDEAPAENPFWARKSPENASSQGRSDGGGYIGIYTPQISLP